MHSCVIGLGSNSLRMLISEIDLKKKNIKNIFRGRDGLRVFAAIDKSCGNISDAMILQSIAAINSMKNTALEFGAKEIDLFATSATRDANNKDIFVNEIFKHTGLNMQVLSGEEEALLSFLGASKGNKSAVIDIGGGSTEIAIGQGKNLDIAASLQLGAVRLYKEIPINNEKDVELAIMRSKEIINAQMPEISKAINKVKPEIWHGVGGTFTTLAAVIQNIPWGDYTKLHEYMLHKNDIYCKMIELSKLTVSERKTIPSIQSGRADIIVNGMAILHSCMDSFNINSIKVSTKGNLDGYLFNKYMF